MTFTDRVREVIDSSDSVLCVGLDPADSTSAMAAERFCTELLEATLQHVCAVKPNIAFFERWGSEGLAALERVLGRIPKDKLVILDAKRGDIGHTADAYAKMAFLHFDVDAVTVNPLMGEDSVMPFLQWLERGIFLLTRTSNPSAKDFMQLRIAGGDRLYERIVEYGHAWDPGGCVGFVVGATDADAISRVRHRAPSAPLLLPGVGAQGADLTAAVIAGMDVNGSSFIVPVSRGLSAAPEGPTVAAERLRHELNTVRQAHRSAVAKLTS